MTRRLADPLLAILGGLAWALCFRAEPLSVASWLALTPLVLLLGRDRVLLLGFLHGLAYWLAALHWIVPTLQVYGGHPGWLAVLLLLGLAAYLALFTALFAKLGQALWRAGGAGALVGLPALWVALEWLRTHLFGGFPWNLAGYAWVEVPGALPLAAWIGAYGISLLVLAANTGLALAVSRRRWRVGATAVGFCLLLLPLGGRWGSGAVRASEAATPSLPVRLLQPNTTNLVEWDAEAIEVGYARLLDQSRRACDRPGALVVWPESANWPFAWDRHVRLREDLAELTALGCPILFNSTLVSDEEGGSFNSALLVSPEGLVGRYDKRHLVPFGEHVPLARWLPFLDKLARNAGAYLSGGELTLLDLRDDRIGVAICFEIVFPGEVVDQIEAGATLLATITNDGWYGDSSAPWQHYRAARFRAAENRRYLLRAAMSGVSAFLAPDGAVLGQLDVGEQGILRHDVRGRRDRSPYSRSPWLVPLVCSVVAASAIFRSREGRPGSRTHRS